jgi:hypothetical protein
MNAQVKEVMTNVKVSSVAAPTNVSIAPTQNVSTDPTKQLSFLFREYDSQLPIVVESGKRVVKALYKETTGKDGKKKRVGINSYIQVPTAHMTVSIVKEKIDLLAPYVVEFLRTEEDKIIKEAHRTGSIGFGTSYFSLEKVIEFIEAESQGTRVNKEIIDEWFSTEVEEGLILAFAAKLAIDVSNPSEIELEKLQTIVDAYKGKFGSLASGKTHYRKEEAELLQKALEVTGARNGNLGSKFYSRLEKMKVAPDESLLMSL